MGAFDGELYLMGYRSTPSSSPKELKIDHGFHGPLTCFIARVFRSGGSSFTPAGYIVALRKKDIEQAKNDTEWPGSPKKSDKYVYYYKKSDAERVVISDVEFQKMINNYKKHDKGYAFVTYPTAIKLENLKREYR